MRTINFLFSGDWFAVKSGLGIYSDWGAALALIIPIAFLLYSCYLFIGEYLRGNEKSFLKFAIPMTCFCLFLFVFVNAHTYYTKSGDWRRTITVESDSTVVIGGTKYHISSQVKRR